jgi:hypothetical protein
MEAFLLARAIANAPAFNPAIDADGKVIDPDSAIFTGTVIGLHMGRDSGYGEYPVVVYKLDDGSYLKLHAFHTLIRNQLAELGTKIGKRQIVSYDGLKRKNNPTPDEIEKKLDRYHVTFVMNVGEAIETEAANFAF